MQELQDLDKQTTPFRVLQNSLTLLVYKDKRYATLMLYIFVRYPVEALYKILKNIPYRVKNRFNCLSFSKTLINENKLGKINLKIRI